MLRIHFKKHLLHFKSPAGTSRGVLHTKPTWLVILKDTEKPGKVGIGECSFIPELSLDKGDGISEKLTELSKGITDYVGLQKSMKKLHKWPGIRFGLESAFLDLNKDGKRILFPSPFTEGVRSLSINGLIWMGDRTFMFDQIKTKIEAGWNCIKLKIGAIDFEEELALIHYIRTQFGPGDVTIRVDANGAFEAPNALEKLKRISEFDIHSIEQPIKAGQLDEMAAICLNSPLPVALDEELIPHRDQEEKTRLLTHIKPGFIILKPGLIGGFQEASEWIKSADKLQISYWATSALEGNIGLNAISQWAATIGVSIPQGLGTGQLYTTNIESPLRIKPGHLWYDPAGKWSLNSWI